MTTYYKMLAVDPDAPSLTYRSWTVPGYPDLVGARYAGPKSGATPFTNVMVVSRYNDGAQAPAPARIISPPPVSTWTWVNQGTSTAVDQPGGIFLEQTAGGAGDNFRMLVRSAPTPPYTLTTGFIPAFNATNNSLSCISWREAGTGELHLIDCYYNGGGLSLQIRRQNSPTSLNTTEVDVAYSTLMSGGAIYFRLIDDNVNRSFWCSSDGMNFYQAGSSVARTTFLTPDQIGFGTSPFGSARSGLLLFHWETTQP